jgi:hypothetical protein
MGDLFEQVPQRKTGVLFIPLPHCLSRACLSFGVNIAVMATQVNAPTVARRKWRPIGCADD